MRKPLAVSSLAISFALPVVAFAATLGSSDSSSNVSSDPLGTSDNTKTLLNPLGSGTTLWTLINGILAFMIRIGAVVIILMMVYVGFMFVTSRGDPGRLKTAKSALLWTIIGAVILLGAQVITQGVCETVNSLTLGSTIDCTSVTSTTTQ